MSATGRKPITLPSTSNVKQHLTLLLLLLGGDIELNAWPRGKQQRVYPCGLCDHPVPWKCDGVCCDECDIWHHRSCIELCTVDYKLLQRSKIQWLCCKCEINLNGNKRNLNILTVNCRSMKDKTSEFKAAANYMKPDIICGTESLLKGEKPGKTSTTDAIKSSEVFPGEIVEGKSLSWSTKTSYQLNSLV
ncbi:unnamed protein product [Mytilus coruscus]|uniref:PHD-type domain-containing protein n=1 Tax=Mytilus coruscus TaxID=42192 RepID=A0A6J8D8W9_MYTCO|nr:unnamed protein product [Mytilus coruscus]